MTHYETHAATIFILPIERMRDGWVNVTRKGYGVCWPSREEAITYGNDDPLYRIRVKLK